MADISHRITHLHNFSFDRDEKTSYFCEYAKANDDLPGQHQTYLYQLIIITLPSDFHNLVAGNDGADVYYYDRGMTEFINRNKPVRQHIVQAFIGLLNDVAAFADTQLGANSDIMAATAEQRLLSFENDE